MYILQEQKPEETGKETTATNSDIERAANREWQDIARLSAVVVSQLYTCAYRVLSF